MNTLYHKLAIASLCTALSFTFGANKEAKAATFYVERTTDFFVEDIYTSNGSGTDGLGDRLFNAAFDYEFDYGTNFSDIYNTPEFPIVARTPNRERRFFQEYNIGGLSLAPNTVISSAIFRFKPTYVLQTSRYTSLNLFGYVGDGKPDVSDFQAGVVLATENAYTYLPYALRDQIYFDVTNFVNERVSNGDGFVGFSIGIGDAPITPPTKYGAMQSYPPILVIETVPEPTTIFGSALALGLLAGLKQKNSSRRNKTTR